MKNEQLDHFGKIGPITSSDKPLVSILVPTYQQSEYIEQCLQGLLNQNTDFSYEILIGDDGSTDGTRAICERIQQEYGGKVRLFAPEAIARNAAHPAGRDNLINLLLNAQGEFIARCDGDDYWTSPDKLQNQVDHLRSDPHISGCFNLVEVVGDTGRLPTRVYGDHHGRTRFDLRDVIAVHAICHPSGFMYRHSALLKLPNWFDTVRSADIAMFSLVAGKGDLACIPEVMGAYRKHAGGITNTALHSGTQYHANRILLWLRVDQYLRYSHTSKCQQVMQIHWHHITKLVTPRSRAKYLWSFISACPSWFLHHPIFLFRCFLNGIVSK